jgi:hypothetical protein
MRGRWRNFENKRSEKVIGGSAYNPKIVSLEMTLCLLLAGITMSLSGCGPLRAYYYQDDQHYRYYETKSDEVLLVSPDGKVGNATSLVRGRGYHSLNERGELVWNSGLKPEPAASEIPNVTNPQWFPWGNWPLSPPDSAPKVQEPEPKVGYPPFTLLDDGVVKWNSDTADWDLAGYEIAPETGLCRVNALLFIPWFNESYAARPYDPFFKKRSCWHLAWAIPTWSVVDAFFLVGVPAAAMGGGL